MSLRLWYNTSMTKSRTEAFSDGVFSIAITLLVLNIKLPAEEANSDKELLHLLKLAFPGVLTFMFSFLVVGVFWVAHHRIFQFIKHMNHYLLWSNIVYLMTIAIIPFPAAILAQHPVLPTAVLFYSGVLLIVGVQHFFVLRYIRKHKEIRADEFNETLFKGAIKTAAVGPVCYLCAVVFSFITPVLSFSAIVFALAFYMFLAPFILNRKKDNVLQL